MSITTDRIAGLAAAIDEVCAADPALLADGETIQALHRQLDRLTAATTRATAAFDSGREWEADGARSAGAWLATRHRLPTPTARRRVRLGRDLRHMPQVEAAWQDGDIGEAHAWLLARARTPATAEAFQRDEEMLVGHASRLRYQQFVLALTRWSYLADADGAEKDAKGQRDRRRLHLSQSFGGIWFGDLLFDPIAGTIVSNQLRCIEQEMFEADWAEARGRLGERATVADLARTPPQRRADALVEMAIRAGTAPADGRRPAPLFTVLVGYETFAGMVCQLANGTMVTPGSLVRWLDEAYIERVVFDGPDRVTHVGVRRRLFAGATRRSVEVRDRECFHEFCDVPAEDCEIDHIEPYAAGGLTTDDNGRAACAYHNRRRHRRTWPP